MFGFGTKKNTKPAGLTSFTHRRQSDILHVPTLSIKAK